ncbi:HsdR [Laribacter hongkongensis HLHK9]|uniref:HsdR n=1 Tax=Laribacter hongkongensis (strain HLHK9) TaxID=557598 RepID=C1D6Q9_LARHH|nr:hypothetical protein [Laribacter hongkongensis]ACO74166.1 HsdR [Laribacter hongkongensis HLHK9]
MFGRFEVHLDGFIKRARQALSVSHLGLPLVEKRESGALSRLNRAYPGKDTTYILDFVNDPQDILKAFKTYYETAELEAATDPHQVFDLRAKLDAAGCHDEYEVDRVVKVELDPQGTQKQLSAAIAPVADRLLKRYAATQRDFRTAQATGNDKAERAAKDAAVVQE